MRLEAPSPRDPRLRLAAIVGGLQLIGQVGLGFELSIPQIAAPIAACALAEASITLWRRRVLALPASAMLTGNSVALLLRAPGTRHGDWWALRGVGWFLLAALLGLGAKYVIRRGPRHVYNPSNLGLVAVLLLAGTPKVAPMFLWWGPFDGWLLAVYLLVVLGGAWVLRPLGLLPVVGGFLLTFAGLVAVEAAGGACFVAIWHDGPVCGGAFTRNLVLSPEVLVFAFLMIPDPRTVPETGLGRMVFGIAVAAVAASLIGFQRSEFGVKVALLAGLAVVSPLVPLFDRLAGPRPEGRRWRPAIAGLAVAPLLSLGCGAATIALAFDERVIESDLPPLPGCHAPPPGAPVQLPPNSPCG